MNKFILDRIESDIAVLETEDCEFINVSKFLLPDNAKEGDMLLLENEKYSVLNDETKVRKERIKNLRNSLRDE